MKEFQDWEMGMSEAGKPALKSPSCSDYQRRRRRCSVGSALVLDVVFIQSEPQCSLEYFRY